LAHFLNFIFVSLKNEVENEIKIKLQNNTVLQDGTMVSILQEKLQFCHFLPLHMHFAFTFIGLALWGFHSSHF